VRSTFDIPAEQRAAIQNALNETFSAEIRIRFETAPELIAGIELSTDGQKVGWNIADYLASLQQGVDDLLKKKEAAEVKAEPKLEVRTEVQPEAKPKPKLEVKPEVKPKPEPEVKTEVKTEAKPEPESRTEVQPDAKSKPAPEVKPEVQPEARPKPEPEEPKPGTTSQ
jgi:F-type H+-transporting ATPase subunit b